MADCDLGRGPSSIEGVQHDYQAGSQKARVERALRGIGGEGRGWDGMLALGLTK
jgi:hypothetical protein